MAAAAMSAEELQRRLHAEFPEAFNPSSGLYIEHLEYGACRVRRKFDPSTLRPGGTISGPTMMALADVAMYVVVLGAIGWAPLAVTTQLNIHFLRKPAPGDLLADARLLRLGKRSAVGEVTVRSDGEEAPVAHATSAYSIPE
ncbi:MAG: PaaI family thioesterase [Variibacter sp.]|nr:PaaI family thioesterase [Variibacter sp.]